MTDHDPPETLVCVSMTFPRIDAAALAAHLAPIMEAAVAAGGLGTSISVQPYDPDEEG